MLTLIVARDRNGAIGKAGGIPWDIPEDLARFKQLTVGKAIIMGRKTWESLPVRPLPSRLNVVVSSKEVGHMHVGKNIPHAISIARHAGYEEIFGIGGEGVYREMIEFADRLLVTEIDLEIDDPDTFFPDIPQDRWKKKELDTIRSSAPRCVLHEYTRV